MNRVLQLSRIAASSLWLVATACARPGAGPATVENGAVTEGPSSSASAQPASPGPVAKPRTIEREDFSLPLPDGYEDVSTEFQKQASRLSVVLQASAPSHGYTPTIVVRKVPIPGGSFDDPATCAQTGRGLVTGGTEAAGTGGTLLGASIIDGPVGKTCQIHLRAPQGIALITELHGPGNTPQTPKDIWLMTCNHGDGDESAEATCRATLAGFRFRAR